MAIPFKKIICPIDFEQNSIAALDVALKLAERDHAAIYLVNIAPVPIVPQALEHPRAWEETAKARLDKIARERLEGKVSYDTFVRVGDPADEIAKVADEIGADLLVIATHGRSGVPRLLLGSVAERVLRESKRPLLIVKPQLDTK
jgi:nucleotide-binding universal stress UspA family protein